MYQHPPPFPRWFAGGLPILRHSHFAASARPFGAAKEGIEVVDADVNSQDLAATGNLHLGCSRLVGLLRTALGKTEHLQC